MHASPFTPLRQGPDGQFHSVWSGEAIKFRHPNGIPVSATNTPEGSWPFAYTSDGETHFVYFTYFLSRTIHKWHLDASGVRCGGLHAESQEIAHFLTSWAENWPEDEDAAWLRAKLLEGVIVPDAQTDRSRNWFYLLERQAARAVLGQTAVAGVDLFSEALMPFATWLRAAPGSLLRLANVPNAYFSPFAIVSAADRAQGRAATRQQQPFQSAGPARGGPCHYRNERRSLRNRHCL